MSTFETKIRGWFHPETRGRFYTVAAAAVVLLGSFGIIASNLIPVVTGVVLAALALIYAFINADATKNKAIYAFCVALGALLISVGWITDHQEEALLAFAAPVLGITYAAAKTPTNNDPITVGAGPDPTVDGWTPTV